jgi:tetratricopeptide (TPR) repeat protein
MVTRNRAFLAGDRQAMRSNWAHVYVTLARQARGPELKGDSLGLKRAVAFADTALTFDSLYVPAMLEAAQVAMAERRWSDADSWLARAARTDPGHSPTLSVRADLLAARARAEAQPVPTSQMIDLYRQALAIEPDLAERTRLNTTLREIYRDQAMFPEAIALAAEQVAAAAPSTYLRDQRDEASVFIATLRARTGGASAELRFFRELLSRKPQQFRFRAIAAGMLIDGQNAAEALSVLDEGDRILRASGQPRADYIILRAAALADIGRLPAADSVIAMLTPAVRESLTIADRLWLVRTNVAQHKLDSAEARLPADSMLSSPLARADVLAARGLIAAHRGDYGAAAAFYTEALAANPYELSARLGLVRALVQLGRIDEARKVVADAERLPMKLGQGWYEKIKSVVEIESGT